MILLFKSVNFFYSAFYKRKVSNQLQSIKQGSNRIIDANIKYKANPIFLNQLFK